MGIIRRRESLLEVVGILAKVVPETRRTAVSPRTEIGSEPSRQTRDRIEVRLEVRDRSQSGQAVETFAQFHWLKAAERLM